MQAPGKLERIPEISGAARALNEGVGVAEGIHKLDGIPAEFRPSWRRRHRGKQRTGNQVLEEHQLRR